MYKKMLEKIVRNQVATLLGVDYLFVVVEEISNAVIIVNVNGSVGYCHFSAFTGMIEYIKWGRLRKGNKEMKPTLYIKLSESNYNALKRDGYLETRKYELHHREGMGDYCLAYYDGNKEPFKAKVRVRK